MENLDKEKKELAASGIDGERDIFERTSQYDPTAKKEEPPANKAGYDESLVGDIKINSPFLKKLENFFYHYKWHTIITVFSVLVLTLCIFQTCKRTTYDAYVLYAGGKNLRSYETGETESTYQLAYKSLGIYVNDYNGDGERNLTMSDVYLPSPDEIKKLEESGDVPYSLLNENDEYFRSTMLSGNYYVCIISEHLLSEWTKDEVNPFVPITAYLPEGAVMASTEDEEGYRLASEYGVYLSSTPLKDRPGLNYLPEDTVICFRKYSKAAAPGKKGKTAFKNAEELVRALLKGETHK